MPAPDVTVPTTVMMLWLRLSPPGPQGVPGSLVSTLLPQCSFFSRSEADVKQLWLQLKKDEPHLLSNFEDFLTRIFSQLLEAHEEKNELECALKKWVPVSARPLHRHVQTRNTPSVLYPVLPPVGHPPELGLGSS